MVDPSVMYASAAQQNQRGGHVAIDFVNTVAWRGDDRRRKDVLDRFSDLLAWSWRNQVLSDAETEQLLTMAATGPAQATAALRNAKRLRESLYQLAHSPSPLPEHLATITTAHRAAMRRRALQANATRVHWTDGALDLTTPVRRLSIEAVDLLTSVPRTAIKTCHDTACGWLFLDRSRRQDRKWCSSADCGNRARVRRHHQRSA